MRIGVVTIFDVPNYGAMLQCYSLVKYLKSQGHEVVLFNIPLPQHGNRIKEMLKKMAVWPFSSKFIKKYLPNTKDLTSNVDAYIVGSDQVWNPGIVGERGLARFLLDFAPDNKAKLSYASSFGVPHWPVPELKAEAKRLLDRFATVTVREESGVKLLREEFGIESKHVLDPCFLNGDFPELGIKRGAESDTLVTFKLEPFKSDSWLSKEVSLAHCLGCRLVRNSWTMRLSFIKKTVKGLNLHCISVRQWVENIANAKYVVTDSFHGMVFAIKYRKQFAVIDSGIGRFTRIESLLCKLGLEWRVAKGFDDVHRVLSSQIDYSTVGTKLKLLQDESRTILKESLNKALISAK